MTPHLDKLKALIENPRLPAADRSTVRDAFERYKTWVAEMTSATGTSQEILKRLVDATNKYKRFIELDLIFDSSSDFLYRQKGQLKLDNSVLEEFLPRLVDTRFVPGLARVDGLTKGPQECFAGLYIGPIHYPLASGGLFIKTKNQDFTVGRKLFFKASPSDKFDPRQTIVSAMNIGYFVAEVKTNLDKTMFQEAAATATELKTNVRESIYVLLAEWLDMPPIDSRMTDINQVILLRKAKRLGSNVRAGFATAEGRRANRTTFVRQIDDHPLSVGAFSKIIEMLNEAFPVADSVSEGQVLDRGYF